MSNNLTKQDEFLIKEYESATQLTYHIDNLRNNLTSFYLVFAGAAAAGVAILVKGEAKSSLFGSMEGVIALLLLVLTIASSAKDRSRTT